MTSVNQTRLRRMIVPYVALGLVAFAAWFIAWGYFTAVEADANSIYRWTDREERFWTTIAIALFAPVLLGAGARLVSSGRLPVAAPALVAATTIGMTWGYLEAAPLEYDNGIERVYPVFANISLGVLGMGMLIPMAIRWREMFAE